MIESVIMSLKNYLSNLPTSPLSLPISTKIIVTSKNKTINNVNLARTDKVAKLFTIVEKYFKDSGDEVVSFNSCYFKVHRRQFETDINGELKEKDESLILANREDLFLSLEIVSGETIYLVGNLSLKSEQPKNCITYQYKEGIVVDYFTCTTCNKNWVCSECIKNCHVGHQSNIFKKDHKTTWACCYCFKGNPKACNLKNKNHS